MEGTLLLCRALDNHNLCYRSFPWNGFPSAFPFPQIIGCGVGGREILRDPCGSRYGHRRVHDRLCPFVLLWFFLWQFIHVRNFVVDHSTWFRWGRFGRRCWWRRRRRLVSWASAPLLCGDSLYPKRIASRPTHFILAFAVRANCTSLDVLPESGGSNSYGLLLLFDGFSYQHWIPTTTILDNLIHARKIPPIVAVLIDTPQESRGSDLEYNPAFVGFLGDELLPWLHRRLHVTRDRQKTVIGGYSMGGSAAAFAALRRPDLFGLVLSQSGSFWEGHESSKWEFLASQYDASPKLLLRFFVEAGLLEDVSKGGPTLLAANRRFVTTRMPRLHFLQRKIFCNAALLA